MWPALIIALLALPALHLWWARRWRRAQAEHRVQLAAREESERVASTAALARQETLLNSMVEGVLVLDAANRVRFANGAFAEMFQVSGPLSGLGLIEAVRAHELVGIVARAAQAGRVVDQELQAPGQSQRWLEVCAAPVLHPGAAPLGTILVFHDVSRLKRLEQTRQEFVANVSNELRTPLSHIKGYTETLLNGAKDDPAVATRFLQTIERNTSRLQLLIEDLLTLSELEAGGVSLQLAPLGLRPMTEKICEDFRARAAARGVALQNEIPELTVRADARRVEQVLTNLLDNALKYGASGGRVVLGGRRVEERAELWVQDFGPGLAPAVSERVFERFYRADQARSRESGGTGLGLAIVKHIVQSHGGQVWVESAPGQGARFFFTLPLQSPEPA